MLLTKITAARNESALSYLKVRGLYILAVVFVTTICFLQSFIGVFIYREITAAYLAVNIIQTRGCSTVTVLENMLIKFIFGVIVRDHPSLAVSAALSAFNTNFLWDHPHFASNFLKPHVSFLVNF